MSTASFHFDAATLKEISFPDTTKVLKAVVVLEAPLTDEIAKKIKCGHLYKRNGDPVDSVGSYSPPIKLSDVEVKLPSGAPDGGIDTYKPELIRAFKVTPKDDLNLLVQFRVHITGIDRAYELLSTRAKYLGKKLECSVISLQNEFNFADAHSSTEDADEEEQDDKQTSLLTKEPAIASSREMGVKKPKQPHVRRTLTGTAKEIKESVRVR